MNPHQMPAEVRSKIRSAPLPVNYEAMKLAIAECARVDECKDIADKHLALAMYFKQLRDRESVEKCQRIQQRARERIGELLLEIDETAPLRVSGVRGTVSNPNSRAGVARAAGLSNSQRDLCIAIARVPKERRDRLIESSPPISAVRLADLGRTAGLRKQFRPGEAYREAMNTHGGGAGGGLGPFLRWIGKHQAAPLAQQMAADEAERLRLIVPQLIDWLDEFEQYLPKSRS